MGEATRRRAPSGADRLPDFIFGRDRATEEVGGFTLAGKLVTDIPKHKELSERDRQLIFEIIGELTHKAQRDPDMDEARIWRSGVKPPDALKPPFSDAVMLARVRRCHVVGVRVDPRSDGYLRLSDYDMADIMGRH